MIVVFGSINLDLVVRVRDLPGAGETVLSDGLASYPGGKGANQALAALRAGADVRMVGAVGRDGFAGVALALLREGGVDLSGVAESDSPTGVALIAVAESGENQIVVASGANGTVRVGQLEGVAFGAGDTLVLQREVQAPEVFAAARLARARGARVVLNNAPAGPIEAWGDLDVVVVNEHEVAALGGSVERPPEAAVAAGVAVVTTLGAEGAAAWWREAGAWRQVRVKAMAIRPVDTTGAGDCFVGALAAALDRGEGMEAALRFGVAASGLACLVPGAQPSLPMREAVLEALARR